MGEAGSLWILYVIRSASVLQDNLVFHDTIANNIGCGDPAYTLPQIVEAAEVAAAPAPISSRSFQGFRDQHSRAGTFPQRAASGSASAWPGRYSAIPLS